MIEIRNLRTETFRGGKRLIADIRSDFQRMDSEASIWIALEEKYSYMLTDEVYDMFLFLPVYMSMYYHTDLYIKGNVSKKLYRNVVKYIQPMMCDFDSDLVKTNIFVDGFSELQGNHSVIGTGLSCGVDCLSTIYDYYVQENDPEYKLTHLFMLNVGWHGAYGDPKTIDLFRQRCELNQKAADAIGLPMVAVDSNLHAFLYELDDRASFFANYSAVFALEKELGRYYLSSSLSYGEVVKYGESARKKDWSEYGETLALSLMQNTALNVMCDGYQYTRVEKTRNISTWGIAQQFLNVCCRHSNDENVDEKNCSNCVKCRRTMIALDGLGMLDNFSELFDLDHYEIIKGEISGWVERDHGKNVFATEIYDLFAEKGKELPGRK